MICKRGTLRFVTPNATYLRQRRRLQEITTRELARASGLSTAFVSLVERGHRRLSAQRYEQLLRAIERLGQEHRRDDGAALLPLPPPPPDDSARNRYAKDAGTTDRPPMS